MTSFRAPLFPFAVALLLAGCTATTQPDESGLPQLPAPPRASALTGLEAVMGHTAAQLIPIFGKPEQDLRESNGRRLQFVGAGCVLDTYLYAAQPGREPQVTYLDTRLPDGRDTDRQTCVNALLSARGYRRGD